MASRIALICESSWETGAGVSSKGGPRVAINSSTGRKRSRGAPSAERLRRALRPRALPPPASPAAKCRRQCCLPAAPVQVPGLRPAGMFPVLPCWISDVVFVDRGHGLLAGEYLVETAMPLEGDFAE